MMPIIMTDSIMAIHLVVTKMDTQYNADVARELVADVRAVLREFLHKDDDVVVNDYYTSAMTCYNVEQPFITNCDEIVRRKMERNSIKLDVDLGKVDVKETTTKCGYC
jgi:DNA-binding protein Fis